MNLEKFNVEALNNAEMNTVNGGDAIGFAEWLSAKFLEWLAEQF